MSIGKNFKKVIRNLGANYMLTSVHVFVSFFNFQRKVLLYDSMAHGMIIGVFRYLSCEFIFLRCCSRQFLHRVPVHQVRVHVFFVKNLPHEQ